MTGKKEFVDSDEVFLYDREERIALHTNKFNQDYLEYLEDLDPSIAKSIGYTRTVGLNLLMRKRG